MKRVRTFVVLDALITLPVLVTCIYSYLWGSLDQGRWFWWAFAACAFAVMLPSLLQISGKELAQTLSMLLLMLYLLVLPILVYGLLYKLHTGPWNVFLYCVFILTVAKSLYSVCVVTKT
jgi:hypothetical protein